MMTRSGWITAALLALGTLSAVSVSAASKDLSVADRHFMIAAADGGLTELKMGEMAVEKSTNADVKEFGRRMFTDHGKANQELTALAKEKGVTLPKDVSAKNRRGISMLAPLNGSDFDRAYMEHMVKDHNEAIADFEKEAREGTDPAIKAWAEKTLPTLREHLRVAQETGTKVGAKFAK